MSFDEIRKRVSKNEKDILVVKRDVNLLKEKVSIEDTSIYISKAEIFFELISKEDKFRKGLVEQYSNLLQARNNRDLKHFCSCGIQILEVLLNNVIPRIMHIEDFYRVVNDRGAQIPLYKSIFNLDRCPDRYKPNYQNQITKIENGDLPEFNGDIFKMSQIVAFYLLYNKTKNYGAEVSAIGRMKKIRNDSSHINPEDNAITLDLDNFNNILHQFYKVLIPKYQVRIN